MLFEEKYCRAGQATLTIWRMRVSCCIIKATDTFRICNTSYFSTATVVSLMHLNVTLIHTLPHLLSYILLKRSRQKPCENCTLNLITVQQDATYSVYYISVGSSTCFGCWHPSSGARTNVFWYWLTGSTTIRCRCWVGTEQQFKLNNDGVW